MHLDNKAVVRPPLRWAGGKSWLAERVAGMVPNDCVQYVEPFVGGASVALTISRVRPDISIRCYDINCDLINYYSIVQTQVHDLISELLRLPNTKQNYYELRSSYPSTSLDRAVRFAYLNRFCFNGLYRENKKGQFNVPYGNKKYVSLVNEASLLSFSNCIAGFSFEVAPFSESIPAADTHNTFFYCDPPYTVKHNLNGFIKYNQNIFRWEDQVQLQALLADRRQHGCSVAVSNANHASIRSLYSEWPNLSRVHRQSVISGKTDGRELISELLISNK